MTSILNHVAILVESIEAVLEKNDFPSETLGEIEEFESEGTRELYIGRDNQLGKLLLMQAIGNGPYKRALDKRGPGLHHIAIDVENISEFTNFLVGSGWSLHPKSIEFYKSFKQVFLTRPQIPVLIEVQERNVLPGSEFFIETIDFPFQEERLLTGLQCERIRMGNCSKLVVKEKDILIENLII